MLVFTRLHPKRTELPWLVRERVLKFGRHLQNEGAGILGLAHHAFDPEPAIPVPSHSVVVRRDVIGHRPRILAAT